MPVKSIVPTVASFLLCTLAQAIDQEPINGVASAPTIAAQNQRTSQATNYADSDEKVPECNVFGEGIEREYARLNKKLFNLNSFYVDATIDQAKESSERSASQQVKTLGLDLIDTKDWTKTPAQNVESKVWTFKSKFGPYFEMIVSLQPATSKGMPVCMASGVYNR